MQDWKTIDFCINVILNGVCFPLRNNKYRICFYSMGVCYCNNNKIVKDISFNNLSSSMEFIS